MKINGRKLKVISVSTVLATGLILTGCGIHGCSRKDDNNTIEETTILANLESTEEPTTVEKIIEKTIEETKEVETTEIVTSEVETTELETKFDENLYIESIVENYYEDNKDYLTKQGIGEDEIRDMYFVINDKVVDEDGNLLITTSDSIKAFANIKDLMYPFEVIQKVYHINDKKHGYEVEDNIELEILPSVKPLIDTRITGSNFAVDKIEEYDEVTYKLITDLQEDTYNPELLANYVKKLYIEDPINCNVNTEKINANGQRLLVDIAYNNALQMAAITNDSEYIDVIKINPSYEELELENEIYQLEASGLLDEYVVAEAINNNIVSKEILMEKYGVSYDAASKISKFIEHRTKMASTVSEIAICDDETLIINMIKERENALTYELK